ncbi:mitochondrial assembly of ribosomal large subunit protein 1 [Myripristis murdjan]|uniref:Mitochondrial assembly of ribosomal large subunit protein 1 n=1 Tax=Myripristis murdjan TaxID=586833 RepID=A0A668A805_9TELE|nr:mitochondrial assembly of ribosomal large subunit protein 1 [Myripristis murdjan]
MCILSCSKHLVLSVSKQSIKQQYAGVFRSACLIPKARHGSELLCRPFTANSATLYHHWHKASLCHLVTKRYRSDEFNERNIRCAGESQEDADEADSSITDADHSQRSSEGFSIDVLVSLLRQENAVDICVIKVPEHIKYSDYFVVVSGISPRHLRAMALYAIKVYKFLKKDADPHVKIEGKDAEDWMCIDFGSMVVHFMLPKTREVYELEKLWTLRTFDEQLQSIPAETLPEDFMYGVEVTK